MLTLEGCTMVSSSLIRPGLPHKHVDYHLASMAWDGSFQYFLSLSDMNYTSTSPLLWGYFPQFVCRSLFLARPGCHSVWVHVSNAARYRASAGPSVRNLKESDHRLLHLILGKSKCEKSLPEQYLYDQAGSRMFMKAVCHITCNLQSGSCCISYSSMLPGGVKKKKPKLSCIAPFPQHLNVANQSLEKKPYMSLCPRSPKEMRNLCVLYKSIPINMPHSLWSLTLLLRSASLFNST